MARRIWRLLTHAIDGDRPLAIIYMLDDVKPSIKYQPDGGCMRCCRANVIILAGASLAKHCGGWPAEIAPTRAEAFEVVVMGASYRGRHCRDARGQRGAYLASFAEKEAA